MIRRDSITKILWMIIRSPSASGRLLHGASSSFRELQTSQFESSGTRAQTMCMSVGLRVFDLWNLSAKTERAAESSSEFTLISSSVLFLAQLQGDSPERPFFETTLEPHATSLQVPGHLGNATVIRCRAQTLERQSSLENVTSGTWFSDLHLIISHLSSRMETLLVLPSTQPSVSDHDDGGFLSIFTCGIFLPDVSSFSLIIWRDAPLSTMTSRTSWWQSDRDATTFS